MEITAPLAEIKPTLELIDALMKTSLAKELGKLADSVELIEFKFNGKQITGDPLPVHIKIS